MYDKIQNFSHDTAPIYSYIDHHDNFRFAIVRNCNSWPFISPPLQPFCFHFFLYLWFATIPLQYVKCPFLTVFLAFLLRINPRIVSNRLSGISTHPPPPFPGPLLGVHCTKWRNFQFPLSLLFLSFSTATPPFNTAARSGRIYCYFSQKKLPYLMNGFPSWFWGVNIGVKNFVLQNINKLTMP